MKLKFSIVISVLLLLTGCAYNTGGPYSGYGGGRLQLKLNQPVEVFAGSSYAYIKKPGQVVESRNDVGTYDLFCKFAVPRSRNSPAMTIQPDTFQVNNVYKRYSRLVPESNTRVAAVGIGIGMGIGGINRGSKVDIELYFELSSANQPLVDHMSCVKFTDPYLNRRGPTMQQVQQVLGNLATLMPADAPVN